MANGNIIFFGGSGARAMKRNLIHLVHALIIGLSLLSLTGCATAVSAVGTGVAMAAEYVMSGSTSKTISHGLGRIKKALLVALCKMDIIVDSVQEIEGGQEIIARADALEIHIELVQITPKVTRIDVKANKSFFNRDKATAQEIVHQTGKIAEKLRSS